MKVKEKNPEDDICQYIYICHAIIDNRNRKRNEIRATWMSTITRGNSREI